MAERLAQGRLPLEFALRCGADIAAALRTVHEQGCAHGEVNPDLILLNGFGVLLLPPHGGPGNAGPPGDVADFGGLLQRMLTAEEPAASPAADVPPDPAVCAGRESVLAAARLLALQCRDRSAAMDMQKAAVHLRLLAVLAQQYAPAPEAAVEPVAPGPAPQCPDPPPAPVPLPPPLQTAPAVGVDPRSFLSDSPGPERNLVPSVEHCPKCGGHYVSISRPRGWFEAGIRGLGIPIRRCCQCFHRYITVLGLDIEKVART